MEIMVLGSGSAGNSCLVRHEAGVFLIDAGLSCKQIVSRLALAGVEPADLSAIFLTHEHQDHTCGLRTLLRKWPVPVYCNAATARALGGSTAFPGAEFRFFETGRSFEAAGVHVTAFPVPHDAHEPVGFRFATEGVAFGVLTDLGYATGLVLEAVRGVSGLLIETNYDETLLQNDTKRPWSVKQRIASRHGHLSNAAAAEVLRQISAPSLMGVVLGHLSRDCNNPELALAAARSALNGHPTTLHCALQDGPAPTLVLS